MNLACKKILGQFSKVLGIGKTPPPMLGKILVSIPQRMISNSCQNIFTLRLTCNRIVWINLGLPWPVLLVLRGRFLFCWGNRRFRNLVLEWLSCEENGAAAMIQSTKLLPSLCTWPSHLSVPPSALRRSLPAPSQRPWSPAVGDAPAHNSSPLHCWGRQRNTFIKTNASIKQTIYNKEFVVVLVQDTFQKIIIFKGILSFRLLKTLSGFKSI